MNILNNQKRLIKCTSLCMIIIQTLTPLCASITFAASANDYNNMEETIIGLHSVVDGSHAEPEKTISPFISKKNTETSQLNTKLMVAEPASNLPSLGSDTVQSESSAKDQSNISGSAMQAGQILSSDNATDSSISYAKGIGEGLINQQVNDWLNQKGTARISAGTDKKISGDLLLPIIENKDNVFFTQIGLHSNEDRDTTNIGMGYRQFVNDWMYGINTFYDYDYTGKNARIGLGGEAWTDYLKLAVNGYYGLTDWHQSRLSAMKDYDERPANGFDLRAEAYLPSHPQLGANLKYEQYFGKGIDLANGAHPDDINDNPKALTLGLNYTPIPLVTVKGEHSMGDKNDSRIGIDINYRLGVPWGRQTSSDSVDALRNVIGSMYEFVDRNYEIVMQYRKQELLNISLPRTITAKAAETIILPLTVSKAKYGLKDVEWTASAQFHAKGGKFRKLSLTQLEVTLPPYEYTNSHAAQEYEIKAIGIDNNGNTSNTTATIIKVEPSKNVISDLTITPSDSVPANDTDYFTITALIVDEENQPLVAQPINFAVDNMKFDDGHSAVTLFKNGKSDSQNLTINTDVTGRATIFVRSKLAKIGTITATMNNGNYKSGNINFIADKSTAVVKTMIVTKDNALANGVATNAVQVEIADYNGNLISGVSVNFTANSGATIQTPSVTTNAQGLASTTLTNTVSGISNVTALVNGNSKNADTNFVMPTPSQSNSLIITDKSVYSAGSDIIIKITLQNEFGNPVRGAVSMLNADTVRVENSSLKSGNVWTEVGNGIYTATYTAEKTGIALKAVLQLNGWNSSINSNNYAITAGEPELKASLITIDKSSYSTGSDIAVSVTLRDYLGNPLTGASSALNTSTVTVPNAILKNGSSWLEQGNGVYRAVYTAQSLGNNLKAALQLTGWGSSVMSENYAITTGEPDPARSLIETDKTIYLAGSDIAVSVTLRDVMGNPLTGASSALTNNTVTVPNAVLKTGSIWNEQGNGLYTTLYTAERIGNNLKAVLQLNGWTSTSISNSYNITAGEPDLTMSNITVDKLTYGIGNDIAVSVTLKDIMGNTLTGASSALNTSTVTVPNAILKNGSSWLEQGNGVYQAVYTAQSLGNNLKATLQLTGWGSSVMSANYIITAGEPDLATSLIATDKTIYLAGSDIAVSVTLRDVQGNPVTGKDSVLNTSTVTVPNATLENVSGWTEQPNGVYTAVYTAQTLGNNLKATLKLPGWGSVVISGSYTIEDYDITLTATSNNALANGIAKNAVQVKVTYSGNPVENQTVTFTATNGAVVTTLINTTGIDGLATASLTNITEGSTLVTATLSNGNYKQIQVNFNPTRFDSITVNGGSFSMFGGFPKTGFYGAFFKINLTSEDNPLNYKWTSSDDSLVNVNSIGQVTLNNTQNVKKEITITATPISGGAKLAYSFTIDKWFTLQSNSNGWVNASNSCLSQSMKLPSMAQLSKGYNTRDIDSLFSEWGNMNNYPTWYSGNFVWTIDSGATNNDHYVMNLTTGFSSGSASDGSILKYACIKTL